MPGFRLTVGSSGTVSYAFMYQIGGRGSKRQTVSLGTDEFLTLKQAREMAVKFRALVVQGIDPQVVEQTTKKKNNQPRLDDVMARYIEINKKPGRYWHERINQIEWGSLRQWERPHPLRRSNVKTLSHCLIRKIERDSSGAVVKIMHGAQKNIHSTMRGFFNWCIGQEYIEFSPMASFAAA